ncbi:hypothetical protein, partial [Paenibacillus sonchi]|uniref:hypothetical protein n=1 Tax=Paenibacillus sonchi TaxID=373687 RepID=UPI001E5DDF60
PAPMVLGPKGPGRVGRRQAHEAIVELLNSGFLLYKKIGFPFTVDILEASVDIKRCRRIGLHPRTEADRGALILPKTLLFQQLRTQESLYRSMEPEIKGKGTNKGISVRCPAE